MIIIWANEELKALAQGHPDKKTLRKFDQNVRRGFLKVIGILAAATSIQDVKAYRALNLKQLQGQRKDEWSVRINKQWRLIVDFPEHEKVRIFNIEDYH